EVAPSLTVDVGKHHFLAPLPGHACCDFELPVGRQPSSIERMNTGAIEYTRRQQNSITRAAVLIIHPDVQVLGDSAFDLDRPGLAVGSEIPSSESAADKRETMAVDIRRVCEVLCRGSRRACRIVGRNDLGRIVSERIDSQRNAIVEDTETAADDELPLAERRPSDSNTRRRAQRRRSALIFHAAAAVE